MLKHFLFIPFLISSCASFAQEISFDSINKNNLQENKDYILGKWQVIDIYFPEEYYDATKTKNINFFGSELWAQSKGKYFLFEGNGKLETNLLQSPKKKPIELFYYLNDDQRITISTSENNKEYYFYFFSSNTRGKMTWLIDETLRVVLKKEIR